MGGIRFRKGFSLVELLIVLTILTILMMTAVAILNPGALVGRGRDTRRKKDLTLIKTAFEEYLSDRGSYPDQVLIDSLRCGSDDFSPWINSWPCDPNGQAYKIVVQDSSSPEWFKVLAELENKHDPQIPAGWYSYDSTTYKVGDGSYSTEDVNYGVSSSNVGWYDFVLHSSCQWFEDDHSHDTCYVRSADGNGCSGAAGNACSGNNCYARDDCHLTDICKVTCCSFACN